MSKRVIKTPTEPGNNGEAANARQDLLRRAERLSIKPFTSLEEFAGEAELTADFDVDEFLRQVREARDQSALRTAS